MTTQWNGYRPYEADNVRPPSQLPRAEARLVFERCMETKSERMEMLRRLLANSGRVLGTSDAAVQELNDWFLANVEADPGQPGRLAAGWYSVVHDVALFLGEVMIERHPNLRWAFFTWGKSSVAFQRHVIMGLGTEDPKLHTHIDVDRMVSGYAYRAIAAHGSVPVYGTVEVRGTKLDVDAIAARHRDREVETDAFVRWLQMVARRA
ncbi:MAG: hypothetical protein HGA44_12250 [Cellulomonadaceae bacterium]|nr:hypothetical protein [Cellulomonadaceae bacterium]